MLQDGKIEDGKIEMKHREQYFFRFLKRGSIFLLVFCLVGCGASGSDRSAERKAEEQKTEVQLEVHCSEHPAQNNIGTGYYRFLLPAPLIYLLMKMWEITGMPLFLRRQWM